MEILSSPQATSSWESRSTGSAGKAHVTLWRGPLIGSSRGGSFTAEFQVSHDADNWENAISAITTVNRSDAYDISLDHRWFRMKVTLTVSTGSDVGITLWAAGLLERRIPRGGPG